MNRPGLESESRFWVIRIKNNRVSRNHKTGLPLEKRKRMTKVD